MGNRNLGKMNRRSLVDFAGDPSEDLGSALLFFDRPKTRCVKCTPMCASARVAPSNIVYSWYGYRSTGTGVLTTKVLFFR